MVCVKIANRCVLPHARMKTQAINVRHEIRAEQPPDKVGNKTSLTTWCARAANSDPHPVNLQRFQQFTPNDWLG